MGENETGERGGWGVEFGETGVAVEEKEEGLVSEERGEEEEMKKICTERTYRFPR